MIYPVIRRAVRCASFAAPLLCLMILCCTAGITVSAMVVGDQIELKATHQAGVPLHQELHATNDFQRIPDGTLAHHRWP